MTCVLFMPIRYHAPAAWQLHLLSNRLVLFPGQRIIVCMNPKLAPYMSLLGAANLVKRDAAVITRAVASGKLPHYITECGKIKLVARDDLITWAKGTRNGIRKKNARRGS